MDRYIFLQALAWIPLYFSWKFFGRLKVYGKENLEGLKSPVIFAANHISELDPIVLPARSINPFDPLMHMYHVSREKTFYKNTLLRRIFYGGLFFRFVGAYPAIVGRNDYDIALHKHVSLLKDAKNVCIFPEGKKTVDGDIQEAKGGVVHLSKKTGSPIIPVALWGYFKMSPRDFFLKKHQMSIMYGEPIYLKNLKKDGVELLPEDYKDIANKVVMKKIAEMLSFLKERTNNHKT